MMGGGCHIVWRGYYIMHLGVFYCMYGNVVFSVWEGYVICIGYLV